MKYLASPYSHQCPAVREARYEAACKATATLLAQGVQAFSSIVHSHPLTRYGLNGGWAAWLAYDVAMLRMCDGLYVLVLDGWEDSAGVKAEIAIARHLGMPVTYIEANP